MKKIIALFSLLLSLTGCATISEPKDKNISLGGDEGVVIFSTVSDGSSAFSSSSGDMFSREDVRLHLSTFYPATKTIYRFSSVSHAYDSAATAQTPKWHVLKLKAGRYMFSGLSYGMFRSRQFSDRALYFTVNSGESAYLGDFIVSLEPSPQLSRKVGKTSVFDAADQAALPPPDFEQRMEDAERKIREYPNFPLPIKVADLRYSEFRDRQAYTPPPTTYDSSKYEACDNRDDREEREKKKRDRNHAKAMKSLDKEVGEVIKKLKEISKKK